MKYPKQKSDLNGMSYDYLFRLYSEILLSIDEVLIDIQYGLEDCIPKGLTEEQKDFLKMMKD